ncbi:hypothetical protein BKA56DRAFT_559181 [Ilyonectria sp. MPI-CAGE-AT-0026]|nr:hypothetical protein BKA56DRAFT_559181 [Ilyonectria sp. MPI-CAGE-AT-0026]
MESTTTSTALLDSVGRQTATVVVIDSTKLPGEEKATTDVAGVSADSPRESVAEATARDTADAAAKTTAGNLAVEGTGSGEAQPTSTSTDVSKPSAGISAGAIVGAAIGSLVFGLILGALGAFFLLRSRKKKHRRHRHRGEFLAAEKPRGSPNYDTPPSTDINLEHFLLDASPEKELVLELQALGDLIRMHVENNYHLQPVQANPAALTSSILKLGLPSASANETAILCVNPQTRAIGLRHLISHVAFVSIDFNARSPLSMLPAPMAAFLQSIPPNQPRAGNSAETSLALSKWRALSAFLLHPTREERTPLPPSETAVVPQAQGLAAALNTVLSHFVSQEPGRREAQADHLKAVMLEFTSFGYMLLSQPIDWQFIYEARTGVMNDQAVVTCAGLERLGRRDGGQDSTPLVARAPEVIRVS